MLVILLIAIIVIVILVKKKKAAQVEPEPVKLTMEDLPDSLTELRQLRDKYEEAYDSPNRDVCVRKICQIGVERYRKGQIVVDTSSENDVAALIHDLSNYEGETDAQTREYLRLCVYIITEYQDLKNTNEALHERFTKSMDPADADGAWVRTARLYINQTDGPRTELKMARRLLRQSIVFHQMAYKRIPLPAMALLLEIPDPENEEEIFKWLAIGYSLDALKMKTGETNYNIAYQPYQQDAELLFQLDWQKLSSPDVNEMLDVYRKGIQQGNAYAMYKMGTFYLNGRYVEKNLEKAMELLEQADAKGLYHASNALCDYYLHDHPLANYATMPHVSKQEIKKYKEISNEWNNREYKMRFKVAEQYADHFGKYVKSSVNQPIRQDRPVQQSQSSQYEESSSQSGGSVRNMPHFIYDDKGREWTFDQMFGSDRVRYVLSGGESTWADDLGDRMGEEVYISDSQISGNSASTGLRTFHW
jgi:hypothetical protein